MVSAVAQVLLEFDSHWARSVQVLCGWVLNTSDVAFVAFEAAHFVTVDADSAVFKWAI